MMNSVETRVDGSTLIVRIPIRFHHHGGRKRIVAPDGSEIAPTSKPQPDGTLVKALARGWRWRKLLDDDCYTGIAELAHAERISRSYVCRVLRLTLLAPDIVERILEGRPTAGLAQFLKPFPVSGSSSATSSAKLKLRRRTARFVAATSMQAAGRHSCSLTCLLIGLTYLVCISKNLAIREISQ